VLLWVLPTTALPAAGSSRGFFGNLLTGHSSKSYITGLDLKAHSYGPHYHFSALPNVFLTWSLLLLHH